MPRRPAAKLLRPVHHLRQDVVRQRAKYRGNQHLLLPADPVLVGLNTLQHWLWQRLQAPTTNQVAA